MTHYSRRAVMRRLASLSASSAALGLLAGCGLIPTPARPKRVSRVGFVTSDPPDAPWIVPLWTGLRELGWVEGDNLEVARRAGVPENDQGAGIAEVLATGVDVLVTVGTASTLTAEQATTSVPVVFTSVRDPVAVGVVPNLARPGGNVTGVSQGASTPLTGKRLEVLRALVPGLQRLVQIGDTNNPGPAPITLSELEQAASLLGVLVRKMDVTTADDVARIFAAAKEWPAQGILVGQSGLIFAERAHIIERAATMQLPALYQSTEFVEAGGLAAYGTSVSKLYRRVSAYVDKILRGARPADLPVEQLTTVEFAVNSKAAEALGLTIPPELAAQVTEWVS